MVLLNLYRVISFLSFFSGAAVIFTAVLPAFRVSMALLLNLHPQPLLIDTRSYYILIKNRLCHVREHRLIRLCIFHMALLQYNTTR